MAIQSGGGSGRTAKKIFSPEKIRTKNTKKVVKKTPTSAGPVISKSAPPIVPTTSATGGSSATPKKTASKVPGGSFINPLPGSTSTLSPKDQEAADRAKAEDLISIQFDPYQNELQRQLQLMQMQKQRDLATQENYAGIADERLKGIYDELNALLQGSTGRTQALYQQAGQEARGAYQDATKSIQDAAQGARSGLISDASQLGLEEALTDPLAKIQQELVQATGRNATSQAGAVSNLSGMKANMTALAEMDIRNAGQEGAQQRSQLANTVAQNMGDIISLANEAEFNNLGQLADLAQTRGAATRQAYEDVVNARTDRERQERQDRLAEELARNAQLLQERGLSLQESQLGLQREGQQFGQQVTLQQLEMQKQQHELNMQQAQAALAAANSPEARLSAMLELQKAQLELDKLNADINFTKAKTSQVGQGSQRFKGEQGVQQAASSPKMAEAALAVVRKSLGVGTNQAPGAAVRTIQDDPDLSPAAKNELLTLVSIYFGNYASYED